MGSTWREKTSPVPENAKAVQKMHLLITLLCKRQLKYMGTPSFGAEAMVVEMKISRTCVMPQWQDLQVSHSVLPTLPGAERRAGEKSQTILQTSRHGCSALTLSK